MKARVKATGEIVHVRPYSDNRPSVLWKDIYRNIIYADCELDFEVTDKDEIYNKGWADGWDEAVKSEIPKIHPKLKGSDPDYWEKLLHQYVGMAMQGILSNPELFKATAKNAEEFGLIVPQAVAIDANCFATALVKKLKSESNGLE